MEQKIRRDLNLGTNLRRLRDSFGISQEKLCAELQRRGCDIGRTTYAKYEAGELNIRASVIVELKKYYIISTHLSLKEAQRVESVAIIKDVVSKLKNKPVFIAGDMNARPNSAPIVAFKEFTTLLSDDSKYTFPSTNPRVCIDYIFGVNGSFKVLNRKIFYESLASDHLPLYVDVKVGKAKKSKK